MPSFAPKPSFSKDRARSARRFLRFVLGAFVSYGAASCVGLLDLNGYQSVSESLCSLLDRCYGDEGFAKCRGHVASQLAAADDAGKEAYLKHFSDAGCLRNCASAWRCLDVPPVCRPARASCSTDEQ